MRSPGASGATPAGVPVAITSPGSSVITCEIHATSSATGRIIAVVRSHWRSSPFTRQVISRSGAPGISSRVTTHGPIGVNVSKDLRSPRSSLPRTVMSRRQV